MKYAAIAVGVGEFSVALMCRVLEVAPSGYYAWRRRPLSDRSKRDQVLTTHVRAAFKASKGRYGSPRVHAELHAEHGIGRKRVARLMRADGLRARPRRRYVVTTQSRHKHPIAPNLVARQFEATSPNQIWVSDLTYLRTMTTTWQSMRSVELWSWILRAQIRSTSWLSRSSTRDACRRPPTRTCGPLNPDHLPAYLDLGVTWPRTMVVVTGR